MDQKPNPEPKTGKSPAQESTGVLEAGAGMLALVLLAGVATYGISNKGAPSPMVLVETSKTGAPALARPVFSMAAKAETGPGPQAPATSALALEVAAQTARPQAEAPVPSTVEPAAKPTASLEAKTAPAEPETSETFAEAKIPPWPYTSEDSSEPQEASAQPAEASEPDKEAKIPPWPYASDNASEPQDANAQPAEASVADAKTSVIDPMTTSTIPKSSAAHPGDQVAKRSLRTKRAHTPHLALCHHHSCDLPSTKNTPPQAFSNP